MCNFMLYTSKMQKYSLVAKAHQIFYTERSYDDAKRDYEISPSSKIQQESLLIVAKSFFIERKYAKCLEAVKTVSLTQSAKLLFERVSLQFRAAYLKDRRLKITKQMQENLTNILDTFQKNKGKFEENVFKDGHLKRIDQFKKFIQFLSETGHEKVQFDHKTFREKIMKQKNAKQFQGFPCYLISQEWLQDFDDAKSTSDKSDNEIYIGPLTNFGLVNDLYENYLLQSAVRNEFIFPGERYRVINKKAWKFYCEQINGTREFFPIKRLFREISSYNSYRCSNWFFPLVPLYIECQSVRIVMQVTLNGNMDEQLLPILQKAYGIGQLKKRSKFNDDMEILDLQNSQKDLEMMQTLLVYEKIRQQITIEKRKIYPLLRFQLNLLDPQQLMHPEQGLKGLQNLGNSCYMNSCLQCISFTKEIVIHLTTTNLLQQINLHQTDGVVIYALADILKSLWAKSDKKSISPHKFKKYFGLKNSMFSGKTQEDAHQFLLQLLNNIHEELKIVNERQLRRTSKLQITTDEKKVRKYFDNHELQQNKSLITKAMRGIIHSTILCNNCKTVSHSYDIFLALSLPIPHKVTPSLYIYFVGFETRHTQKYEIYLDGVKNAEDVFNIFKKEVFKQEGKNNAYIMISVSKKTFRPRSEHGELNIGDGVLSLATAIEDLIESSKECEIIIYELKKKEVNQQILLIEYCDKNKERFAFPRFLMVSEEAFLKGSEAAVKKMAVDSDTENYIRYNEIYEVESAKVKQNRSFQFRLQLTFRKKEKFFDGSSFVDRQLNTPTELYTLNDCFNFMKQPEILENSWRCGKCKSDKRGEKKQQLVDASNILIISLKRFKADYRKIKSMVSYPIEDLNITEWLEESTIKVEQHYDLYAVCLHQGNAEFGHYRAYCKHFVSGDWYQFDDSFVKKVDPADIVSPYAYMLFYKRRDI